MSFRCNQCKKPSQGKPNRVVVRKRDHVHTEVRMNEEGYKIPTVIGMGTQIAAEVDLCSSCLPA